MGVEDHRASTRGPHLEERPCAFYIHLPGPLPSHLGEMRGGRLTHLGACLHAKTWKEASRMGRPHRFQLSNPAALPAALQTCYFHTSPSDAGMHYERERSRQALARMGWKGSKWSTCEGRIRTASDDGDADCDDQSCAALTGDLNPQVVLSKAPNDHWLESGDGQGVWPWTLHYLPYSTRLALNVLSRVSAQRRSYDR